MRTRLLRDAALAPALRLVLALLILAGSAAEAVAQTAFVPYFGKNRIRYDRFDWHIYTTDHFEIFYYPEIEKHLERVAGYAESAYQQVSADLKHDLAFKIPLVLFKTHSEFEEQNVMPGEIPEGVAAFAEPQRDRMVLPIDEPPDQLYGLIAHELTHIFEFDIIPRSLIRRSVPLWVDEGLSDYERGSWDPLDIMTVRDAAVADIIPAMSNMEEYGEFNNPRLVYNLGHAVFEFIESRWGKEGIRQFLFALRKNVIGGGENAYDEAFKLTADEFDEQFEKYIKERFKPFRDKERPADYGKNLAPKPERTKYTSVFSIEPSPSGDLIAGMAVNRKERELDIILLSTKDGSVIRNLTNGFDKGYGWEYLTTPGMRWNRVPLISWSPVGDRIAYFVRNEKTKTLVLQNVLTTKVEQKIDMKTLDEPESPDIAPNGKQVVFGALNGAVGDIYMVDLDSQKLTNLTNDDFADYAPTYSHDGTYIVYLARVSGNDKLFRLDLDTKKKTQLTFGTHDDSVAQFLDDHTLVFSSTATDPNKPLEPEVARNGAIYNIWTLDLNSGELKQYTDTLGGNLSAVALKQGDGPPQVAFVTYFKGEYEVHTLDKRDPIVTSATADFGAPGPIIDFQAPLAHTLVAENKRRKKTFEKLFLEGRPPVNVGVTSGGDVFGGSQLTFSDVLGDHQFSVYAASISQYRTMSFSYLNLSRRFQFATQGFSQTQFFYGLEPGLLYDPAYGFLDRDQAVATRTVRGGTVFGIYPLDRYRRLELSSGVMQYREEYNDPGLEEIARDYQVQNYGTQIFNNGTFIPLGVALVGETTVFREYGPLAGSTYRFGYEFAPKVGNSLSRQTVDADARYYMRIGTNGVLAVRGRAFKSWGDSPDFLFFGGNSEMHGYRYLEFIGHKAVFADAELRFPLIDAALTPIGVIGGVRGVFFANIGGAGLNGAAFKFWDSKEETYTPVVDYRLNARRDGFEEVLGSPTRISGFRLKDGRAAYGVGLETFALGFPIHFDWSWKTLFNKTWEDALFAADGGSSTFRKPKFDIWIGYDF